MRLRDMTIQRLPVPERGQKLDADDSLPGFGVRVSQGGTKPFGLIIGQELRPVTIGRYPVVPLATARKKARQILAERQPAGPRQYRPAGGDFGGAGRFRQRRD